MTSQGDYSVVVDIDDEGDLGDLDYNPDPEFQNTNFPSASGNVSTPGRKPPTSGLPPNSSGPGKLHMWDINFYAQFFDINTNDLLVRCKAALYPKANFLDVIDGNPDLYGPIWITTTVVLVLFLTGTLAHYFNGGELPGGGKYDFRLLTGAAGLMYGYTFIIPVALWGALKWWGGEAGLLEVACLYGYANLVWIPVAVGSISTITILNYVFVAVGFAMSAMFLFRNLFPIVSSTDAKTAKMLLIVAVAAHAGLAITIKILFFQHGSPVKKT